jgi:sulfite dehydrogenase
LLAASTFLVPPAFALDIVLPPETAVFKPSDLPGYVLAQRNCMTCHSVHYIQSQPPTSPRSYWEATVKKMKKPFGAHIADEDIPAIADYLVKTYGAERSTTTTVATAAHTPSGPADAKTLATANNCMACHAIDKKIVGPAFKDIAEKYKGSTDALTLVASHIRAGGSGKWGAVPMPPFQQLSVDEANALARFVLSQ